MGSENQNKKQDGLASLESASFRAGEIVGQIIDEAILKGDYSSLNRRVADVLDRAADAVREGAPDRTASENDTPYWKREEARTYRASTKSSYNDARRKKSGDSDLKNTADYLSGADGVASPVSSYVKAAVQIVGAFFFGICFLGSLAAGTGGGMWIFSIFLGLMTALLAVLGVKNMKKISRIKLARKVLKLMAGREYISVDEVAAALGKDHDSTAQELRGIIQDNAFTGQAYMDRENTTFMTSHKVYQQYEALEQSGALDRSKQNAGVFRQKDLKEYNTMKEGIKAREKSEAERNAKLDRETRQMLEEGRAFIQHIHEKNDEIPGEEFSDKLYRLEEIVTGIFDRVAADPGSAPDLHRMMKYYLPTTQKLVDTYATLDSQNISGENVENAKREIERSLDTINSAFERFLDQFFQDTAWDVSSDISVMGTMMAQDGLTGGNDFAKKTGSAADSGFSSDFARDFKSGQVKEEAPAQHGYTEGYTQGYSDSLGSGAAYATAPDEEGK